MKSLLTYIKCFIGLHDWGHWLGFLNNDSDLLELSICKHCGHILGRIRK